MDKKLSDKLFKKFKFLKKKTLIGIEVSDKWFDLVQDMFQQLSTKLPTGFLITKVFSKYGKLQVHTKGGDNTTRFIIEAAIEQSENTCEGCGKDKELQSCEKCKEVDDGSSTYVPDIKAAIGPLPDPNANLPVAPISSPVLSGSPADYYFKLENNPGQVPQDFVVVCPKFHWDMYKFRYDDEMAAIELLLPQHGFNHMGDDEFEYNGQIQAGRTLLISLGFVENLLM